MSGQVGKGKGRKDSSHLPVLMEVLDRSTGAVLECGSGRYSTPFLHWACLRQGRHLVTLEGEPRFFDYAKQWASETHEVVHVTDWDDCRYFASPWSVVFIDHEGPRRAQDAVRVARWAEWVVLHDTCGRDERKYHYRELAYPAYKYRWQWGRVRPKTSVVSNFVDVSRLAIGGGLEGLNLW